MADPVSYPIRAQYEGNCLSEALEKMTNNRRMVFCGNQFQEPLMYLTGAHDPVAHG